MTEQREKAAAEPPLDCNVGRDELCLEDDGDIGIDWATPERDMLSISLHHDGSIAWAVLVADGRKAHGTAQLAPEAFEVLRKLVPNDEAHRRDAAGGPSGGADCSAA